jgi:hypothetical protein
MTEKNQILVVEDDSLVAEVIAAALDDMYPTKVVESSGEALGLIRTGTAVILMSGDPGRMAQLTDQPLPFVLKPFTLAGLLNTVETVLASAQSHVGVTAS